MPYRPLNGELSLALKKLDLVPKEDPSMPKARSKPLTALTRALNPGTEIPVLEAASAAIQLNRARDSSAALPENKWFCRSISRLPSIDSAQHMPPPLRET